MKFALVGSNLDRYLFTDKLEVHSFYLTGDSIGKGYTISILLLYPYLIVSILTKVCVIPYTNFLFKKSFLFDYTDSEIKKSSYTFRQNATIYRKTGHLLRKNFLVLQLKQYLSTGSGTVSKICFTMQFLQKCLETFLFLVKPFILCNDKAKQ